MKKHLLLPALLLLTVAPRLSAGTTNIVTLSGTAYTPSALTINAGDTVVFTNISGFHSVLCETPEPICGSFPSPQIAPWSFPFTYSTPGTYRVRCGIHSGSFDAGMRTVITVLPSGTPPPTLTSLNLAAGQFSFTVLGRSSATQVVEQSGSLSNWTPVFTNAGGSGTFRFTNQLGVEANQFFRASER